MNIIVDGSINWYAWQLWVLVASFLLPTIFIIYVSASEQSFGDSYGMGIVTGIVCFIFMFCLLWQPVFVLTITTFIMVSYLTYKLGERR